MIKSMHDTDWADAEVPPQDHHCWGQTRGFVNGSHIERCPCGAIRFDHRVWMDRNTRRPPTPEEVAAKEHDKARDGLIRKWHEAVEAGDQDAADNIYDQLRDLSDLP